MSSSASMSDADVETQFRQLAPSLGLPAGEIEKMTMDKKRMLISFHSNKSSSAVDGHGLSPEALIKRLESGKDKEKTVEKLRTCIRSELVEWTNKFLELNGHQHLFEIYTAALPKAKKSEKDVGLVAECCRCMKALMNTPEGLQKVLDWPNSIDLMWDSLECLNIMSQEEVLIMLAGLCFLSPDAHTRLLTLLRKRKQFPQLMEYLGSKNEDLVKGSLTFINALIGTTGDTQSRVEVRKKFLKMNIKDLLAKERHDPSEALKVQINAFMGSADEDLDMLVKAGAISPHAAASPDSEQLQEKIKKLETQVKSLEFELTHLKEDNGKLKDENTKLKANPPPAAASGAAAPAITVTAEAAPVGGGPPPPPPPTGGPAPPPPPAGGPAPPPPPPPGGGGPPPPPPPPGGGGPPPPPPPPGGGGPPPPPPPGGGGPPPPPGGGPGGPPPPAAPKRPAKAKCTPAKKMRNFGWNKIADAKIDNTIWEKTNDSKVKIDTLELESLFGANEAAASSLAASSGANALAPPTGNRAASGSVSGGSPSMKMAKAQAIQLLDPKRSNNCEIMLRGLKMEPSAIKAAIMALDDKVLTEDTLKTMKEYVPQPEEIAALKEYTGDKKALGRAEQYMLAVMEVPKLSARLTAMAVKAGFNEKSEVAKSEIQTLSAAISSVKNSKHLLELLEIILAIGNYMNGQGNNGGCYGFRVGSLNKMLDVKSMDNKQTLVHYLCDFINKKNKDIFNVLTELSGCAEAARLNIRETIAKVSELKSGFATVETLLKDPAVDSAFTKAMQPFTVSAKTTVELLESSSAKLEASFKETAIYYGEPGSVEPEDFFGALATFVETLGKAKTENEKRSAAAAKEAQSKALLASVQSKQVTKKKGQLDDAIEGMKTGAMFARLSVNNSKG